MRSQRDADVKNQNGIYLVALHSCSESLGIATINSLEPDAPIRHLTFSIGKKLSNKIISCFNEILPTSYWKSIGRLAVAIGPGGFTSTRITVALGRTLAQQIGCSLDGISSFELMAPRLAKRLSNEEDMYKPFWITKEIARRGVIAGQYQLLNPSSSKNYNETSEIKSPYLLESDVDLIPFVEATDDVQADTIQLLKISLFKHRKEEKSPWNKILPIYPTSPVE